MYLFLFLFLNRVENTGMFSIKVKSIDSLRQGKFVVSFFHSHKEAHEFYIGSQKFKIVLFKYYIGYK